MVFHLNKHETPSSKDALYQVRLELAKVLEKKKMWKIYDNYNDDNDVAEDKGNGQIVIRKVILKKDYEDRKLA